MHFWSTKDREHYLDAHDRRARPTTCSTDEEAHVVKGYLTSYAGLFEAQPTAPRIASIEIPLIQRDYAQGRTDATSRRSATTFLEVLIEASPAASPSASTSSTARSTRTGRFHPLDGQQRLTTLFLLHWYLASAAGQPRPRAQPWTRFSYATRPSARLFCESPRAATRCPTDEDVPSEWIKDQPWYLHTWRNDPTIQSMLVMLDAIHDRGHDRHSDSMPRRLGRGSPTPKLPRSPSTSCPSRTWTPTRTSTSR